jgi:hypothetical protein
MLRGARAPLPGGVKGLLAPVWLPQPKQGATEPASRCG